MGVIRLALAAVLATLLAFGVGHSAAAKARPRVAYVTLPGNVPNARDLFGLPLQGFVRAVKHYGVDGRVVYVPPNQDPTETLASLARQKYDLVIIAIEPRVKAIDAVAGRFPDTRFLLLDTSVASLPHRRANVQGTLFRAEEAGFLAGYLAALMEHRTAGRHVVSSVGGFGPFWGVDRWIVGFDAGARKADPRVTVLKGYSQDFANEEKCRTIALGQIAKGSGVVFNVAGACGLGALAAAKDEGVWGDGVDVDQSYVGSQVLTSAITRRDRTVDDAIRRLVEGTFTTGGDTVYDLANGGVGLGRISPAVPKDVLRRLDAARRQIVTGAIEVPVVKRA